MDKRTFLKVSAITTAGIIANPFSACTPAEKEGEEKDGSAAAFELPELGYGFDALQPNIDARTMEIHHGKHHAGYVRKLNAAVEGSNYAGMELTAIMAALSNMDKDTAVRNNGGGHYNHSLFGKSLGLQGEVSQAVSSERPSMPPSEATRTLRPSLWRRPAASSVRDGHGSAQELTKSSSLPPPPTRTIP